MHSVPKEVIMANSVDPDQLLQNAASDQVLQYLIINSTISVQIIRNPLSDKWTIPICRNGRDHMSHITRKRVFGDFQPGKIQTSLLSYRN